MCALGALRRGRGSLTQRPWKLPSNRVPIRIHQQAQETRSQQSWPQFQNQEWTEGSAAPAKLDLRVFESTSRASPEWSSRLSAARADESDGWASCSPQYVPQASKCDVSEFAQLHGQWHEIPRAVRRILQQYAVRAVSLLVV